MRRRVVRISIAAFVVGSLTALGVFCALDVPTQEERVAALIRDLGSADPSVQENAAYELGKLAGAGKLTELAQPGVVALIEGLETGNEKVEEEWLAEETILTL